MKATFSVLFYLRKSGKNGKNDPLKTAENGH